MKIVWAFDPYVDFKKAWKRTAEVIRALQRTGNYQIQPVYVLSSESLNWVTDLNVTETDRFVPQVKEMMHKVLKKLDLSAHVRPPEVVVSRRYSRRYDIKEFLKFCDKQGAGFILTNTHAREGVKRFFMGSFAETLLHSSKIPILYVSPNMREVRSLKTIFFPTDFSIGSKQVMQVACESLKRVGQKFILFNRIPYPIQAFSEAGVTLAGGGWISVEEFITSDREERQRLAVPWSKIIRRGGFKVDIQIREGDERISDDILSMAKTEDADIIAMGSEVGGISQALIGSMARNVIRESTVPVWVMHYPK